MSGSDTDALVQRMRAWFDPDNHRLDAGDVAALRRTRDPRREAAYWRVVLGVGIDDECERRDGPAWAEVLRTLAFAWKLHEPTARLGRALARPRRGDEGGAYSQIRFERLLGADGERLHDEVRLAVRFLVSCGASFDVAAVARLLLVGPDHRGGPEIRRILARDYFSALPRDDDKAIH